MFFDCNFKRLSIMSCCLSSPRTAASTTLHNFLDTGFALALAVKVSHSLFLDSADSSLQNITLFFFLLM